MANPQLENGHTQIANELMDAFARAFPGGSNAQILLAIIRCTYGWHKKQDAISISQLADMTGCSKRTVIYALQNLEAQRFIIVQRHRGRGKINQINTVAFQKNYELWVVQRKSPQWLKQLHHKRLKYQAGVVQRTESSAENQQKVVQRKNATMQFSAQTKDNTKDNIQKKLYGEFKNIMLTDVELQKLQSQFGTQAQAAIEELSAYCSSRGKTYRNYYATLLNWIRRKNERTGQNKHSRALPKTYTPGPEYGD